MKSVQNIIAAAVVLATLPFANAGVAKAVTTTVSAIGSSAPTTIAVSGSSAPTTVAVSGSSAPTTVAVSGSIGGTTVTPSASFGAPPTASTSFSSVSASTGFPAQSGGFVVTGIYTTCLTVTFDAAPTASASTGLPISFSNAFPTTTAFAVSASASSFSEAAPSFSASAEPVTSTVIASSSVPENVAVFTTCLAFLPGASSASATSTAVASFSSASASTVAFSTAPASVLTTRVASSRAAGATTTRVASSRAAATPTVA
ncbi:hypothetical protein C8R44DRAFT_168178 [Mycena epipterygia]|nr:hypothetical protein C8R44DRAFT_168178 [Mycena epipterygia]